MKEGFTHYLSSKTVDLRVELEKLMFSEDKKPLIVSNNPASFMEVMIALTNYEKQVRIVSIALINTLDVYTYVE